MPASDFDDNLLNVINTVFYDSNFRIDNFDKAEMTSVGYICLIHLWNHGVEFVDLVSRLSESEIVLRMDGSSNSNLFSPINTDYSLRLRLSADSQKGIIGGGNGRIPRIIYASANGSLYSKALDTVFHASLCGEPAEVYSKLARFNNERGLYLAREGAIRELKKRY